MKKDVYVLFLLVLLRYSGALSLLVEGNRIVPHSFTIVNCFQLLGLLSVDTSIKVYFKELEAPIEFRNSNFSLFQGDFERILSGLEPWNGQHVDIIYRITFPLDIKGSVIASSRHIPTVLFYVATLSIFTHDEFLVDFLEINETNHRQPVDDQVIRHAIDALPKEVYFVTPSPGSAHAMRRVASTAFLATNHRIIPHGVDMSLYFAHFNTRSRNSIRAKFGISSEDILLLHISALVLCKGIDSMLLALYYSGLHSPFKLVLKGLDDIYQGYDVVMSRLAVLVDDNVSNKLLMSQIVSTKIVFIGHTHSFDELNDLYNAADAYVSPYVSEGFNLPVLEAIAVGVPVFVSSNGSSAFFVNHVLDNVPGAKERIFLLPSDLYEYNSLTEHTVNPTALYGCLQAHRAYLGRPLSKYYYYSLRSFLFEHYSWQSIAKQFKKMLHEFAD